MLQCAQFKRATLDLDFFCLGGGESISIGESWLPFDDDGGTFEIEVVSSDGSSCSETYTLSIGT